MASKVDQSSMMGRELRRGGNMRDVDIVVAVRHDHGARPIQAVEKFKHDRLGVGPCWR